MGSIAKSSYTTSFAFFEALWEAGITHVFVNLGSDHPSIMEAMVKGTNEKKGEFPKIITCPNEMVALSMADGFARLTRKPQCVIVHVDVGTQGLAAAVHNASAGRAPVLIFAGLSPITLEGEYRGPADAHHMPAQPLGEAVAIRVAFRCWLIGSRTRRFLCQVEMNGKRQEHQAYRSVGEYDRAEYKAEDALVSAHTPKKILEDTPPIELACGQSPEHDLSPSPCIHAVELDGGKVQGWNMTRGP